MDTTTLLGLCIGAGQLLFALLVWLGWDKRFMSDKVLPVLKRRAKIVPILIIGGLLFSGIGFYRAFTHAEPLRIQHGKLIEVRNRNFVNEKVLLDGHDYSDCTFTNVTFVYNGTSGIKFHYNKIIGSVSVNTENESVFYGFALLKGLGAVRDDVPLLGPNREPMKNVETVQPQ